MSYKIKLQVFEGPLDLLIYLVKKDHLNIYDIPIAQVTEQYLAYLELMKLLDLNIAGEFLVMAATLMQIKSKMLLPADETKGPEEEVEDPRAELVRRLLEYEKFKEIAENLRKRESERQELFSRPKAQFSKEKEAEGAEKDIPEEVYFEASLFDLISAFSRAMENVPKDIFYEVIKDEFTVEEKIHQTLHYLLVKSRIGLGELFAQAKNKVEIVVTFLAVLELIRMKEALAVQKGPFQDIEIIRNKENIVPYEKRGPAEVN